jgi:hypothetical protein
MRKIFNAEAQRSEGAKLGKLFWSEAIDDAMDAVFHETLTEIDD